MEGIESRNVWVIDIAIMNIANEKILRYFNKKGVALRIKREIRLICIPGIRPVITPNMIPRTITNNISTNI